MRPPDAPGRYPQLMTITRGPNDAAARSEDRVRSRRDARVVWRLRFQWATRADGERVAGPSPSPSERFDVIAVHRVLPHRRREQRQAILGSRPTSHRARRMTIEFRRKPTSYSIAGAAGGTGPLGNIHAPNAFPPRPASLGRIPWRIAYAGADAACEASCRGCGGHSLRGAEGGVSRTTGRDSRGGAGRARLARALQRDERWRFWQAHARCDRRLRDRPEGARRRRPLPRPAPGAAGGREQGPRRRGLPDDRRSEDRRPHRRADQASWRQERRDA